MDRDREPLIPKSETSFGADSSTRRSRSGNTRYGATPVTRAAAATPSYETAETSALLPEDGTNSSSGVWGSSIEANGVTPHQPASLNVVRLSYTIRERPGQWWNGSCFRAPKSKHVLRNLCMTFHSGQLTALVGNSGSGKTSLLDVISCRAAGEVKGVVSYKDEECTRPLMKQKSSYVLQADRLLPTLTARETLTYMAYLKLPGHLKHSEIDAKVQSVLDAMGLRHVADNKIGGAVVRGVSGGEKRRITIGVQLLKDPEMLLLDEPTSGLDAFTARHLVSSLAELAHKGKMVIMSIHQPRSDIFVLLDKIGILTVGQLAYLGTPAKLVPYFTSIGYPCPRDQNPCDVYIDITSVDRRRPDLEKKTTERAQNICNSFSKSDLQQEILGQITSGLNHHYSLEMDDNIAANKPSWTRKFTALLNRMNVHLYRDRGALLARILFLPLFIPFIIMFLGRLKDNQQSIQDRLGLIYQSSQVPPYMGLTDGIALFPVLREVFYRECHDGLYSTPTFLAAYFVHCLPFNIVTSMIFATALYWVAGLNPDLLAFGQFVLLSVILIQFGEILTVSVLGVFRNPQLANNTSALTISASGLLASGLLRVVENMPKVVQYAGYIAIHKYSTEIAVANEFHGLSLNCDPISPNQQCIKSGDEFLHETYPDAMENMNRNWGLMGGYSIAIFILSVMLFKIRGIPTLH